MGDIQCTKDTYNNKRQQKIQESNSTKWLNPHTIKD